MAKPNLSPMEKPLGFDRTSLVRHAPSVDRDREEPAQVYPVPARPRRRVPRPDQTQPRTRTTVEPDPAFQPGSERQTPGQRL